MSDKDSDEVDLEDLRPVLYYDALPERFTERAKKLFPVVKKMFPKLSLKDWLNGFTYDLYPEMELARWEDKVKHYLDEIGKKKRSLKIDKQKWAKVLDKMGGENYLEDLLRKNGIESEEDEEDSVWGRR